MDNTNNDDDESKSKTTVLATGSEEEEEEEEEDRSSMMEVDIVDNDGQVKSKDGNGIDDPTMIFIESICELIRDHVIELLTPPPLLPPLTSKKLIQNDNDDDNKKLNESIATSKTDQFEIVIRQVLLNQLQTLTTSSTLTYNVKNDTTEMSSTLSLLCKLWKDCVVVCYHLVLFQKKQEEQQQSDNSIRTSTYTYQFINCNSIRKLPIIVLEDIIDVLSIPNIILFWKHSFQPIQTVLFSTILWSDPTTAWLPFLKVGNKLWKRLTTERSLYYTNSTGTNTTSTLSSDVPKEDGTTTPTMMMMNIDTVQQIDEIAADVMLVLSTVYPLSEKSAVRPWGNYNSDHTTMIDDESIFDMVEHENENDDINNNSNNAKTEEKGKNGSKKVIVLPPAESKYSLYSNFWMLQQDLCTPNKLVSVGDFLQRLKFVLPALENYQLNVQPEQQKNISTSTNDDNTNDMSNLNPKSASIITTPFLLTSSRIFEIQLSDPTIRIQLLTQFCIVVHHLLYTMPTIGLQAQVHQPIAFKLLQQATNMVIGTATTSTSSNNSGSAVSASSSKKNTTSTSTTAAYSYLDVLNTILQQSETQWRAWKRVQKCSPIVILEDRVEMYTKYQQQQNQETADVNTTTKQTSTSSSAVAGGWSPSHSVQTRKRKWIDSTTPNDDVSFRMVSIDDTVAISQAMSSTIPSYDEQLEDYVEALDPANGIDDEYHPKRNTNFTWQALRVLAIDMIPNFHRVNPSGDFENLVRHVYVTYRDTIIPGTVPELYEWIESEEEKDDDGVSGGVGVVENGDNKNDNDNDSEAEKDEDHEQENDGDEGSISYGKLTPKNDTDDGEGDRNDTDQIEAVENGTGNNTPMHVVVEAVDDNKYSERKSPIDTIHTDEIHDVNGCTPIKAPTETDANNEKDESQAETVVEKSQSPVTDNDKSDGETETHPDDDGDEKIVEVTRQVKNDIPTKVNARASTGMKKDNEVSDDKAIHSEKVAANGDDTNRRKRGRDDDDQQKHTLDSKSSDRPMPSKSQQKATVHDVSNRKTESTRPNNSSSKVVISSSSHRNTGTISSAWSRGANEYASGGRDIDVDTRDVHQNWPRQQLGPTSATQTDRRSFHSEITEVRRGGGNRGTDIGTYDSRRGSTRDYTDDRRGDRGGGSGGVDDDTRYDHRRDHRNGGDHPNARRGIDNNVSTNVRQSEERGRGGGSIPRSRDDYPSRNDDWRTSDRGGPSRRGRY